MTRPDLTKTLGHGTPDWGFQRAVTQVFPSLDLAELAVRLGSPDIFNRSGTMLFYDDFSLGLTKGKPAQTQAGTVPALSVARAGLSGYTALCKTAAVVDAESYMFYRVSIPQLTKMGLEGGMDLGENGAMWQLRLYTWDGTFQHLAGLRFDPSIDTLYYWSSAATWVAAATNLSHLVDDYLFHVMKLIIDPATKKYVRAIYNDRVIDLSTISYQTIAETTAPSVAINAAAVARTAAVWTTYLSHVIFTINEP